MGELTILLIVVLMLFAVCFIGSLILAKNTKEFHISFGLKGFNMSGSFYKTTNPKE